MRTAILTLFIAGAALAGSPTADAQKVLDQWADAFNSGDASKVTAQMTDDATVITPDGQVAHGTAQIQKMLDDMFKGEWKGTSNKFTVTGMRAVGNHDMWIDATHSFTGGNFPAGSPRQMHVVALLKREGPGWLAAEVRPYPVMPKPRNPPGAAKTPAP